MKYILIDDDPIINLVHKKVIMKTDLEAEVADFISGRKALDYFQSKQGQLADIVLLDINMPEMNGFEFLDALLKNKNIDCNKLKIFILTSSLNVKDKEQAGKYPILKGYLEKPLNILNFKELIQQGFNFQGYTV
ncbi:response regulator [Flavobacterium sp.]|uniref:response regulator n=1 Tax=Flavobacterium sp. TaxID=239 RepID=UPI0025D2AB26|nr:response regulator [Flavobacterium sp.]